MIPLKKFGQHFLHSRKAIDNILASIPLGKQTIASILEIGPGAGAITIPLYSYLKSQKDLNIKFIACDIDARSIEELKQEIPIENLRLGDFLADCNSIVSQLAKPIWVVSNLPYNVGTPILVKLLYSPDIIGMTLMLQKEVGVKLLPDSPMSSLKALSMVFGSVEKVMLVPPGAFRPPPKVDSIIFQFIRHKEIRIPLEKVNDFEQFLRKLFATPRKQLGGILKKNWPHFQWTGTLNTIRTSELSFENLVDMFSSLV